MKAHAAHSHMGLHLFHNIIINDLCMRFQDEQTIISQKILP